MYKLIYMYLLSQWDPPALEYVTNDMVDAYFAPLGDSEPELKLPIESREAFV
jgi:3-hydroxyisobutyryl-CoA hydrolase